MPQIDTRIWTQVSHIHLKHYIESYSSKFSYNELIYSLQAIYKANKLSLQTTTPWNISSYIHTPHYMFSVFWSLVGCTLASDIYSYTYITKVLKNFPYSVAGFSSPNNSYGVIGAPATRTEFF